MASDKPSKLQTPSPALQSVQCDEQAGKETVISQSAGLKDWMRHVFSVLYKRPLENLLLMVVRQALVSP